MNPRPSLSKSCALACLVASVFLTASVQAQSAPQTPQASQQETQTAETLSFSQSPELIFELRALSFHPTDSSFDALSDDDTYTGGMLGAGYDIGRLTVPGLRAYLLYFGGGTDIERFDGDLDMSWSRNLFMAAADFGPELFCFFRPSARLGVGYALQELDFETSGASRDDYAHDLVGLGSIGLEFFTPKDFLGPLRFSLIGEFGYQAQTQASFDEFSAEHAEDDPWVRQEASLGELNTDGLFWDLGVGIRMDL
jgi:hypothetical protein